MIIKKIDRRFEKDILTGMIVDKNYFAQIRPFVDYKTLKCPYARTIAGWCVDYFDRYKDVPFEKIKSIYELHSSKGEVEADEVDLIEKLLQTINDDYTQKDSFNSQFLLDVSEDYLNRLRIEQAIKNAQQSLAEGNVKEAQSSLVQLRPVNLTARSAIDPLSSKERIEAAFANKAAPIVILPGDMGELLNEQLTRGSLVGIQGPEKGCKTWLLHYIKLQALRQGRKVLEVQLGDLTEGEVIIRDSITLAQKSNKKRYCGRFKRPIQWIKCNNEAEKECKAAPEGWDVEYEEVVIDDPLTWEEAWKASRKFYKEYNIRPGENYRLLSVPARQMNMKMLATEMERLYLTDGFIPDLVIPDYMDICAKENQKDEGRDQINENWIEAKAIVNGKNCLIVTATQADAGTYDGKLQTRENFSNDKRKYGHVNGMFGINSTDIEKKAGILKFNAIVARDGDFVSSDACYILQCLRCGQAVVDSLVPSLHINDDRRSEKQRKIEDAVAQKIINRSRKSSRRG